MQDLNDLYYFAKVVEAGGFAAAGRLLGIPKSRLSRRIAELEERLGARLLQRTTRQLTLTAVGERYLRHCQAMLLEAEMADEAWPVCPANRAGACGSVARWAWPSTCCRTWLPVFSPPTRWCSWK